MDNNHIEFNHTFHRLRQENQSLTVNNDFENKVLMKIRKKKTQRKVAVTVSLSVFILAFMFIAQALLFQKRPETTLTAKSNISIKEEIPVIEDVIYSSSDSSSNYAIELVAYHEDQNSI